MQVLCVKGHEGVLEFGEVYTVKAVTPNGNYLLEGVEVPEGYTSFSRSRFGDIEEINSEAWIPEELDSWSPALEEEYWANQLTTEHNA